MKLLSILLLLLSITLVARENPFSPIQQIPEVFIPQKEVPKLFIDAKPLIKPEPPKRIEVKPIEVQKITWKPKTIKKEQPKPVVNKKAVQIIKKKKPLKAKTTSKLIYKNRFTKIKIYGRMIKIYTKDTLLNDSISKKRLILNFERFDPIQRRDKKVSSKYINSLQVGFHSYYHRFIFNLKKDFMYDIQKKPYGYLVTLL